MEDDEEGRDEDELGELNTNVPSSSFVHLGQPSNQSPRSASALCDFHVPRPQATIFPNPSQSHHFHADESAMAYSAVADSNSNAQQGALSLDPENQFSSAINTGSCSEDDLNSLNLIFEDTVSWPLLHESLFLSNPPHTMYGNFDLSATVFNRHVDSGAAAYHLPTQADLFGFRAPDFNGQSLCLEDDLPVSATRNTGNAGKLVADELLPGQAQQSGRLDATSGSQAPSTFPEYFQKSDEASSVQNRVINELVAHACSPMQSDQRSNPSKYWQFMSPRVAVAFDLNSRPEEPTSSTLQSFVDLYFKHFSPLWPLISLQNLDLDNLHPLLYLVLTSIGAMYAGPAASNYGASMHSSVRVPLTMAVELNDNEDDHLWLAQARLLTQVTALYFGQPRAFSYSQHLGCLLVAQARRMELFSATRAEIAKKKFQYSKDTMSDADRLRIWLQLEARRRLAFGILRGATYISVLLHTKPLVLMEEIDLEFPMCDTVWRSRPMAPRICLQMIEHDQSLNTEMRASDVYRIAMDRNEPLPPLNATSHELLLFGLQWPLWQFSRDQRMFSRLTEQDVISFGLQDTMEGPRSLGTSPSSIRTRTAFSEAESLDRTPRQMSDLRAEYSRFTMALQKWERALSLVKRLVQTDIDRSSLLSSLILYHLSYVRLNAPMETLHQIQYRLVDNRPLDKDLVEEARRWANSAPARVAAEKACTIWSLISRESSAATNRRARFNLLAFTGLHHSAVLLWAFAGAHRSGDEILSPDLILEPPLYPDIPIPVSRSECSRMLASFVRLYDFISPARWSSFAKAADVLKRREFPSGW